MHIYFVNKKSSLKGPFDITDSNHKKIISIGDVILRDCDNYICFLLVVSDTNRWNTCINVGKTKGDIGINGNTLLLNFDVLGHRFGNINAIKALSEIFTTSPLHDFFENALSILTYKCDFWDIEIFNQIHNKSSIKIQNQKQELIIKKDATGLYSYLFESFLNEDLLRLFRSLKNKNILLREIYMEIRKQYPNEFWQALQSFLKQHPNSSIYDEL